VVKKAYALALSCALATLSSLSLNMGSVEAAQAGAKLATKSPAVGQTDPMPRLFLNRQALAAQHYGPQRQARSQSVCRGSGNDFAPPLLYCGTRNDPGVVTGQPKVYLVFWGSQWGQASTNSDGYKTFSGDPKGIAAPLQAMYAHFGTGDERWSAVFTQYCQDVAQGESSCPASSSARVAYPSGGVLAGLWADTNSAAPDSATQAAIKDEARAAATHFSNSNAAANQNVQYIIVSPTGTHPDGFETSASKACAWHSYTYYPGLAYTNLPYIPDAGYTCGANSVNASEPQGSIDGATTTAAHEYAETLTDPAPNTGWLDSNGWENGDQCAWTSEKMVSLGSVSVALSPTWSNDSSSCAYTHSILLNSSVSLDQINDLSINKGSAVSIPSTARDSAHLSLTYSATGLPTGLTINASSGTISGASSQVGSYPITVQATNSAGSVGETSFTLTVLATISMTAIADQRVSSGQSVSLQVHASQSESEALTYTDVSLPEGLSIDPSSGLISGTITSSYAVTWGSTVWATDGKGASASRSFNFIISMPTVRVTRPRSQQFSLGKAMNLQVVAVDSGGGALTYTAKQLPAGLGIDPHSGAISGTPSEVGIFTPTVTVKNSAMLTAKATFTINVAERCITAPQVTVDGMSKTGKKTQISGKAGFRLALAGLDTKGSGLTTQTLKLPSGCSANLIHFSLAVSSKALASQQSSTLKIKLGDRVIASYSTKLRSATSSIKTLDLGFQQGTSADLSFVVEESSPVSTSFKISNAVLEIY